jgi:hypothetical protein
VDQLSPGEYRSHIYVRAVPMEKPLGDTDVARDTGDISVKLTAIFGLSVPALVRVGENDTKITLTNPVFTAENKTPRLSITLNRQGQMSSYGDMTVEHIAPDGQVTQVGIVKGIAVYTPNKARRFRLDLDREHKVDYHTGRLHIAYRTQKEAKVQDAFEAELTLQ